MMSRGIGSVVSLVVMSRIRDRFDSTPIAFLRSSHGGRAHLVHGTVDHRRWRPMDVIWTNFVHGCFRRSDLGTAFSASPYRGCPPSAQDQGFALFYLNFDLGSSIGTVAIIGLHARHAQINHALLTEQISPFNELLYAPGVASVWDIGDLRGLAVLTDEISRQATMIAYNNSFLLTAVLIASLVPLILLFRVPRGEAA